MFQLVLLVMVIAAGLVVAAIALYIFDGKNPAPVVASTRTRLISAADPSFTTTAEPTRHGEG